MKTKKLVSALVAAAQIFALAVMPTHAAVTYEGFESGTNTIINEGNTGYATSQTVEVVDKTTTPAGVYEGDYGLHYTTNNAYTNWGYDATVEADHVYLVQVAAKGNGSAISSAGWRFWGRANKGDALNYNAAPKSGTAYTSYLNGAQPLLSVPANEWAVLEEALIAYTSVTDRIQFYLNGAEDIYLDNFYFGELEVADVTGFTVPTSEALPGFGNGDKIVPLGTPTLLNQLGTETGLKYNGGKANVTVRFKGTAPEGVELINNDGAWSLKISETAKIQNFVIEAGFDASEDVVLYQNVADYWKEYPVALTTSGDSKPYAYNAVVTSDIHTDGTLTIGYDFYQENGEADTSTYIWETRETADDEWQTIAGEEGLTYEVDAEYDGFFFRAGILPTTASHTNDTVQYTTEAGPPVAPIAKDIYITGTRMVGDTLTGHYTYFDSNFDAEGTSTFRWLRSDAANGTYTAIPGATSSTYVLTNDDMGMFLKFEVTPVSTAAPTNEGGEAFSGPEGGFEGAIVVIPGNLLGDGSFESGAISGWLNSGAASATLVNKADNADGVYAGEYSVKATTPASWAAWGPNVTVTADTLYIASAKIKAGGSWSSNGWRFVGRNTTGDSFDYASGAPKAGTAYTAYIPGGSMKTVGTEWDTYEDALIAYTNTTDRVFMTGQTAATLYMDDMYFGKLAVADVTGVTIPSTLALPGNGNTTTLPLGTPALVNQLGTQTGFTYANGAAKGTVRLKTPVQGVEIVEADGYYSLKVDDTAYVGDVVIEVGFDHTQNVALYQNTADFWKEETITLIGSGDKTPYLRSSGLTGTVNEGDTLTLTYFVYQEDNETNMSEIKWYRKATTDGAWEETPCQVGGTTYTVTSTDAGYCFRVSILPKTTGHTGTLSYTVEVGPPVAPEALDITVTGNKFIGDTLTGSYTFYDYNQDLENEDPDLGTTYRWLRSDTENGVYTAIASATEKTYVLTEDDVDMFLKFEVTPKSLVAPEGTAKFTSSAVTGPQKPVAKNLKITKSGTALVGSYTYEQRDKAPEGQSLYKWTVDGTVVSTTASYVPAFKGSKIVTFEVTPVSSKEPSVGDAVQVSITYQGGSSSGGPSSSSGPSFIGGTSGSMAQTPVTSITVPEVDNSVPAESAPVAGDIEGHWGADAITWAVTNEIMTVNEDGNFGPNEEATREEVIRYLAKLAGFEPTESQGIFGDVEGEFADILQTFVDKGVISVDVNFRPYDSLSRQELCKIFALTLGLTSENIEATTFADNGDMGDWAIVHINAMCEAGFMQGTGNNAFSPRGTVTNAQMATLLQRAQAKLGE